MIQEAFSYTKEFGIDIAAMIMTSMSRETPMMRWLNFNNLLYLVRPFLIRLALTTRRKYQLSIPSMIRYKTFSILSHISLTYT
jgi:hypothetical protein